MKKKLFALILCSTLLSTPITSLAFTDYNNIDPNALSKEELVNTYNELLNAYNALTDAYMDELIDNITGASEAETKAAFPYVIASSSNMENTIMSGDVVYYDETAFSTTNPQRQDIVIFESPLSLDSYHIQRIIGLPGETVEIRNAKIYIDGSETPLEEDYLKEEWVVKADGFTFDVPEDCYLMLGDNRNNSNDARYWADEALTLGLAASETEAAPYSYISNKNILGKVMLD